MKIKGTGARMASNPDAEPDFYSMRPLTSMSGQSPLTSLKTFTGRSLSNENTESNYLFEERNISSPFQPIQKTCMDTHKETKADENQKEKDTDFVFDNMPFHSLSSDSGASYSRRHSLADIMISRRASMSRASCDEGEVDINRDLDCLLSSFGNGVLSDMDLAHSLDNLSCI